jgi:hypothetical protein
MAEYWLMVQAHNHITIQHNRLLMPHQNLVGADKPG